MDKEIQEKSRTKYIELYYGSAWEALFNFDYYSQRYAMIEKNILESMEKSKAAHAAGQENAKLPDAHTKENRTIRQGLFKDGEQYAKQAKGMEDAARKLWEEAIAWREKGVRLLEQAEGMKNFKLNTPEEIEAKKNAEVK